MKTFVALLLLLNIAVFAWFQQWLTFIPFQPADLMPAATTPPPSKLPSLVLLREQQQAIAAAEAAANAPKVAEPKATEVAKETTSPANTPKTVEKVAEKPAVAQPASVTATPATSSTQLVNASTPAPSVATSTPSTPNTTQPVNALSSNKSANIPPTTANATNVAPVTPVADTKTTNQVANAKVEKPEKIEKAATSNPETAHTVLGLVGKITDRLSNAVEDLSSTTTSPAATEATKKVATANDKTVKESKEQEPKKETATTEAHKENTLKAANADKGQALNAKAENKTEKNPNNEAVNKTVGLESASATEKPETAGQDKNKTTTANKTKTTNICYLAGYFEQKEFADSAATWFNQQHQQSASVVQRTTETVQGTQLYLAVFDNLEAVQKANKVLTQQGIQDHFVVQQDNQYIISLGLYKEAASLEKRQKELKAKGYPNVKAVPHYLSTVRYWLNVQLPSTQKVVIERFQKAFANITTQTVECS